MSLMSEIDARGRRGEGLDVGEGNPLYKPYAYGYVPPQGVWFLGLFGLESGMVFEGTTGAYERIYRFK